MVSKHSHLIELDEAKEELTIYRVYANGERILYTGIPFSQIAAKGYTLFTSELGEAIVFDTPVLRQILEDV